MVIKQTKIILLIAFIFAAASPALAGKTRFQYKAKGGDVILVYDENTGKTTGTFGANQKSRINGQLTGQSLKGSWDNGQKQGPLVFIFNKDFSKFKGKWKYPNAKKWTEGWDGALVKSEKIKAKAKKKGKKSANPELMAKLKGKWKKPGPDGGMIEFKDGKKTTYENNKVLESAPFALVNPCKILVYDGQEEREFAQTSELGIIKIKNECYSIQGVDDKSLTLMYKTTDGDPMPEHYIKAQAFSSVKAIDTKMLEGQWKDKDDRVYNLTDNKKSSNSQDEYSIEDCCSENTSWCDGKFIHDEAFCYQVLSVDQQELLLFAYGAWNHFEKLTRISGSGSENSSSSSSADGGEANTELMAKLNGKWKQVKFPGEVIEFKDGKFLTYADNKVTESVSFNLVNSCKFVSYGEEGPYEETQKASKHGIIKTKQNCWDIQELDGKSLTLWYMIHSDDNEPQQYIKLAKDGDSKENAKSQSSNNPRYQKLQGKWRSASDPKVIIEFKNNHKIESYGAEQMGKEPFTIVNDCNGKPTDSGEYLQVGQDFCYYIVGITKNKLTLSYMGGTGKDSIYNRVN